MTYIKGKITELFDKLPGAVQSFIYDPATEEKIKDIGKKYSLNDVQLDRLLDEVQYVIIGYKQKLTLAEELEKNVGIGKETSGSLFSEINEKILKEADFLRTNPASDDEVEDVEPAEISRVSDLDEKYKNLPNDVRQAITSVDVGAKIAELAKKYRLHIDKADEFSAETGLVMLGITHPKDYLGNIRKKLEMPEEIAKDLVADVNAQIFQPIRDSLKKIHQIEGGGGTSDQTTSSIYSQISQPPIQPTAPVKVATAPIKTTQDDNNIVGLGKEDEKILADSGIEIEKASSSEIQSENIATPRKEDLINELENPELIQKNGTSMAAGFIIAKNQPVIPTPAPIQITTEQKTQELKQNIPEQKPLDKKSDPYREPID